MPTVTKSSLNLSVKNATEFEKSINQEERVLSFFLGGADESTDSTNAQINLNNTYEKASFFKRIDKSDVSIVAEKINWSKSIFNIWNPYSSDLNNYYVVNNKKVYLVVGDNEQNDKNLSGKYETSSPPTHTEGSVKYGDGYEYFYLYDLPAQSKIIDTGNLWISVPNNTFSQYAGRLLHKQIDTSLLSDITINIANPEIEILSDTGAGAKIILKTEVLSSPTRTLSEREYKIVGIDVSNIGTSTYQDFNLTDSLTDVLTKSTTSTIETLVSSIQLGFTPANGLQLRETLQANYALLSLVVNSTEISSVTDQKDFFVFGVVEGVTTKTDSSIFVKGGSTSIVTNNLKLTAGATAIAEPILTPTVSTLAPTKSIKLSNKTTRENAKIASSVESGSDLLLEVQLNNKDSFEVGDTINVVDGGATDYEIKSVTKPDIKNFSGNTLHTGKTSFNSETTSTKTFLAQVVQKF